MQKSKKFTYPNAVLFEGLRLKLITGSEGTYLSKCGRAFSMRISGRKKSFGSRSIKELKRFKDTYGYKRISIRFEGKRKSCLVHRLVITTFKKPSLKQVDHINGDKENNALENLRYVTSKENAANRKSSHGRKAFNEFSVLAVLTYSGLLKQKEIAELFNVSIHSIKRIYTGETWGFITDSVKPNRLAPGLKKEGNL